MKVDERLGLEHALVPVQVLAGGQRPEEPEHLTCPIKSVFLYKISRLEPKSNFQVDSGSYYSILYF